MFRKEVMERLIDTYFLNYVHTTRPLNEAFTTLTQARPVTYQAVENHSDGLNRGLFEAMITVLGGYIHYQSNLQRVRDRFLSVQTTLKEDCVDLNTEGLESGVEQHISDCHGGLATVNRQYIDMDRSNTMLNAHMLTAMQALTESYQACFAKHDQVLAQLIERLSGIQVDDNQTVQIILQARSLNDIREIADRQTTIKVGGRLEDYKTYITQMVELAVQASQQSSLDNPEKIRKLLSEASDDIKMLAESLTSTDDEVIKQIKASELMGHLDSFLGQIANMDEMLSKIARIIRDKIPSKSKDTGPANSEALTTIIETTPQAEATITWEGGSHSR